MRFAKFTLIKDGSWVYINPVYVVSVSVNDDTYTQIETDVETYIVKEDAITVVSTLERTVNNPEQVVDTLRHMRFEKDQEHLGHA